MTPSNEIWSGALSCPLDYQFVLWIDDLSTIDSLVHVGGGIGGIIIPGGSLEHLASTEFYVNVSKSIPYKLATLLPAVPL